MLDPDRAAAPSRVGALLTAGLLAVAACLLWRGTLGGFFNQDDFLLLNAADAWSKPGALRTILGEPGVMEGTWRPLSTYGYFGVMRAVFGLEPAGYHAVSLLVHIATGVLVFGFVLRHGALLPGAALGTAFFLSRDASFANVYWISAIQDSLMALFATFGVAAFVSFAKNGGASRAAGSAFLLLGALLSKESAVALVPLFPLAAFLFGRENGRRALIGSAAPVGVAVVWAVFRGFVIGFPGGSPVSLSSVGAGGLVRYLGWMLDGSAFSPSPWIGVFVLLLLAGWPVLAAIAARNEPGALCSVNERSLGILGAAWTLLALIPALALTDHACQYYLLLPLCGFAVFLSSPASALSRRLGVRLGAVFVVAVSVVFFAGAARVVDARAQGEITPGGFYHPANDSVNRAYVEALETVGAQVPDGGTVILTGYPASYALEGRTWEAIAELYFDGRFRVVLAGDVPTPEPGARVLSLDEAWKIAAPTQ